MIAGNPLILVVDDDEALREAVAFVLEGEGCRVRGFESAEAFLEAGDIGEAGCLLLDVKMAGMSGPELQEALLRAGRTIPIVFLSANGSIDLAVDLMQKGAVSFLPKPVGSDRLIAAVERALNGAPAYGAQPSRAAAAPSAVSLTPREEQVTRLVCSGLTNREIAERLGLSKRTVEFFRASAMRKLGAASASELKARFEAVTIG